METGTRDACWKSAVIGAVTMLTVAGCFESKMQDPQEHETDTADTDAQCRQLQPTPLVTELWFSDALQSADGGATFAVDDDGRLVYIDRLGNLMRRESDGTTSTWVETASVHAENLMILPTGEAAVLDSGIASLVKFHPKGARTVLLSGLDQPSGMEMDLDGNLYIGERLSRTIRRVNPADKTSEIIARNMSAAPASLAFSPDFLTLYFTGESDGTVWALRKNEDGQFGTPERFGEVPGRIDPCADKPVFAACEVFGVEVGTCTPTIDGDIYCQNPETCAGKEAGESCTDEEGRSGECVASTSGALYCSPTLPCSDKAEGDACTMESGSSYDINGASVIIIDDPYVEYTGEGVCEVNDRNLLVCRYASPCENMEEGDTCTTEWGEPGLCTDLGGDDLYCEYVEPCYNSSPGDSCETEWGSPGVCLDDSWDYVNCEPIGTCGDMSEGDECTTEWGKSGQCTASVEGGQVYCTPVNPCAEAAEGDACVTANGVPGECVIDYYRIESADEVAALPALIDAVDTAGGAEEDTEMEPQPEGLYCRAVNPCEDKADGDDCTTEWGAPGRCVDWGGVIDYGDLDTDGAKADAAISFIDTDGGDVDADSDADSDADADADTDSDYSDIYCEEIPPCDGKTEGDTCSLGGDEAGICVDEGDGYLYCDEISVCDTAAEGDTCGEAGTCTSDTFGGRYCQEDSYCSNAAEGDDCYDMNWGLGGICAERTDGDFYCKTDDPCRGAAEQDDCVNEYYGFEGTCTLTTDGALYCRESSPCDGKSDGENCSYPSGEQGICVDYGDGYIECEINWEDPCNYLSIGDACTQSDGSEGICVADDKGYSRCGAADACAEAEEKSACTDSEDREGVCMATASGGMLCEVPSPCTNAANGDACTDPDTGGNGRCETGAFGTSVCRVNPPCETKAVGETCRVNATTDGICIEDEASETHWCHAGGTDAGLGGITTDRCGNVYVADAASDALWRFDAAGQDPVFAADTGRAGVTQLMWGIASDAWQEESLYLGIRGTESLAEVAVGIQGRPRALPGSAPTPDPVEDTAFDCIDLPDAPLSVTELDGPHGYHDVAFDNEGYLIGLDDEGTALLRVNKENEAQVFAPGVGHVEGMDWLPDGSLAAATDEGIVRIYPNGAKITLAADIFAYGLTVGPDGLIYAGTNDKVYRVDPETGDRKIFIDPADEGLAVSLRGVDFDPDHTLLYITTLGNSQIWVVPLDEQLNPVGSLRLFATIPGSGFQDGIGVDICGNLYVPVFEHSALYRITPDGTVKKYLQLNSDKYGHGLEWGSGIGGFDINSLYLPQPYDENTVLEINIGVPSRRATVQPPTKN